MMTSLVIESQSSNLTLDQPGRPLQPSDDIDDDESLKRQRVYGV
jgi:hypothetical protein